MKKDKAVRWWKCLMGFVSCAVAMSGFVWFLVPSSPPTAATLLDEIHRSGAESCSGRLLKHYTHDDTNWQVVLDGVRSGDPAWLDVASALAPGMAKHVHPSEEFFEALSSALRARPELVLERVRQGKFNVKDVCWTDERDESLIAAVEKVTAPQLAIVHEQCLGVLKG